MTTSISTFPMAPLSEHAKIEPGFAFKSERFTENADDVALVKGENVQQGYVDWAASKYWPERDADIHRTYRLNVGDIVLAMDRPWVTAGLKWAYIKPNDPEALLVQRVSRLRAKVGLDQTYLRCLVSSNYFSSYIQPIVTGVNVPHISGRQIGSFQIPIPEVHVQRKIAAVIAVYDDLIENNRRRIALLERMAEQLYREWFVRFRFPGDEYVTFSKGLPKCWEWKPLSSAVCINPTERPVADSKPYVGMEDLSLTSMCFSSKERRIKNAGSKFRNRDVLFPRITPSLENGKRGFVMGLAEDEIAIGSTEFIVLRERLIGSEHIYFLSCSSDLRMHAEQSMVGASGRQRVQEKCFDSFLVAVPPLELSQQFAKLVRPFFDQVFVLERQNVSLKGTRDLLLPRLISGKLRVDELDIQFPPSMQAEHA